MTRLHLIGNSHLDPVWLWDWREGLNEAVTTCRTILRLMGEFPEMTYIRGEASTYEHIRRHDPATFERIVQRIAEGRWDVVGGSLGAARHQSAHHGNFGTSLHARAGLFPARRANARP